MPASNTNVNAYYTNLRNQSATARTYNLSRADGVSTLYGNSASAATSEVLVPPIVYTLGHAYYPNGGTDNYLRLGVKYYTTQGKLATLHNANSLSKQNV